MAKIPVLQKLTHMTCHIPAEDLMHAELTVKAAEAPKSLIFLIFPPVPQHPL